MYNNTDFVRERDAVTTAHALSKSYPWHTFFVQRKPDGLYEVDNKPNVNRTHVCFYMVGVKCVMAPETFDKHYKPVMYATH